MKRTLNLSLALATLVSLSGVSMAAEKVIINGAGATFPYPIYQKWFSEFNKSHPDVEINYQSVGSGAGIKQLLDQTVDFGASDAPMSDEELAKAPSPVTHIPTVMGAVAVTYNLPEAKQPLNLDAATLADLFMGKITTWNDPKIAELNKGVTLPSTPVAVVYRSDGSGTTYVFTEYLTKVSKTWETDMGTGKSVKWKTGMGGKGNEGVTGLIKQTPGTIGYVELVYAESNKLPVARLKNAAGSFVAPSLDAVSAAAEGAMKSMPADFRTSITNAAGAKSYPISAFTYLLVPASLTGVKGKSFQQFLTWAMADGQKLAGSMSYAPLPKALVAKVTPKVNALGSGGETAVKKAKK